MTKFFKLNKELSLLCANKIDFINKIHQITGMSLILSTELFIYVFKEKEKFTYNELCVIIDEHPRSLLYKAKINYIIERCHD